jgi:hypothetical protein
VNDLTPRAGKPATESILWTLTTLLEKLIKIGAKVVRHSGKTVFQMTEVVVPQELFRAIVEGIGRLSLPTAATG